MPMIDGWPRHAWRQPASMASARRSGGPWPSGPSPRIHLSATSLPLRRSLCRVSGARFLVRCRTLAGSWCCRRRRRHAELEIETPESRKRANLNSRLKQVARGKAVALIEARRATQGKKSWILTR
jgi:hypothetical protein